MNVKIEQKGYSNRTWTSPNISCKKCGCSFRVDESDILHVKKIIYFKNVNCEFFDRKFEPFYTVKSINYVYSDNEYLRYICLCPECEKVLFLKDIPSIVCERLRRKDLRLIYSMFGCHCYNLIGELNPVRINLLKKNGSLHKIIDGYGFTMQDNTFTLFSQEQFLVPRQFENIQKNENSRESATVFKCMYETEENFCAIL